MMLASPIMVRVAAMSRRGEIRWGVIPKLVDLDLCSYDVCSNLLDHWSVREFVKLVEIDN